MLRGQDHVASARPHEDIRPLIRLEQFGGESRGEVLILEILAVVLDVKLPRRAIRVLQGIPIPLSIAPLGPPRRHGIDTPVDENAKLGFVKPGGDGARIQRFPVGFVFLGDDRERTQCQQQGGQWTEKG